jgi:DNA segregation ATPase FtsK/SpoIIIE-like protein
MVPAVRGHFSKKREKWRTRPRAVTTPVKVAHPPRAAQLIDLMERDGIVGAADGPKPREVLKRPNWISEIEESMR